MHIYILKLSTSKMDLVPHERANNLNKDSQTAIILDPNHRKREARIKIEKGQKPAMTFKQYVDVSSKRRQL
jgi:hypothetical protein